MRCRRSSSSTLTTFRGVRLLAAEGEAGELLRQLSVEEAEGDPEDVTAAVMPPVPLAVEAGAGGPGGARRRAACTHH